MRPKFWISTVFIVGSAMAGAIDTRKTPTAPPILPPSNMKAEEMALFDGKTKYDIFKVFKFEQLKLSEDCKPTSGKPSCEAYKATLKMAKTETKFEGNPASTLCRDQGGTNLIALDSEKNSFEFCRFSDQSMVGSWSLYYSFYDKNYVK
jgi:putative hemolysin